MLAELFGVPASDVTVRSGATSRVKRVRVAGVDEARATERLRQVFGWGGKPT